MSQNIQVRVLLPDEYERWNLFVERAEGGSIYSDTRYLTALSDATESSFRTVAAFRGSELVGGIGLYERNSRAGRFVAVRLLLYYNGIVLRDYQSQYPSERTARQLSVLSALEEYLRHSDYSRLVLHCRHTLIDLRPFMLQKWEAWPSYSYLVKISDLKQAWSKIEQNCRRLIERAEKGGVTVSETPDFQSFYKLHLTTAHRKGAPVYLPEKIFRKFFDTIQQNGLGRLFHAHLPNGEIVASQLVLHSKHPVTHTVCAGAHEDYLALGVTPYLRWKAFEALSKAGYAANDLTDAALNEVSRFKSQLGGDLVVNFVMARPDSLKWRMFEQSRNTVKRGRGLFRKVFGR